MTTRPPTDPDYFDPDPSAPVISMKDQALLAQIREVGEYRRSDPPAPTPLPSAAVIEKAWNDGYSDGYNEAFERYGKPAPVPEGLQGHIDAWKPYADAIRAAAAEYEGMARMREACARLIEEKQEEHLSNDAGDYRSVGPRREGNLAGIAYAAAIRALPIPSPPAEETRT